MNVPVRVPVLNIPKNADRAESLITKNPWLVFRTAICEKLNAVPLDKLVVSAALSAKRGMDVAIAVPTVFHFMNAHTSVNPTLGSVATALAPAARTWSVKNTIDVGVRVAKPPRRDLRAIV